MILLDLSAIVYQGALRQDAGAAISVLQRFDTNLGEPIPLRLVTTKPELSLDDGNAISPVVGSTAVSSPMAIQRMLQEAGVTDSPLTTWPGLVVTSRRDWGQLTPAPGSASLLVSGDERLLHDAGDAGWMVLGLRLESATLNCGADWRDVPAIVAHRLTPDRLRNRELAAAFTLEKTRGITGFKCLRSDGNSLQGQGSQLLQVQHLGLGPFNGVFVPMSIDVSLHADQQGKFDQVQVGSIDQDEQHDMLQQLQMLIRRGQLVLDPSDGPAPNATHQLETDTAGRRVVARKRFHH